MDVEISRFGPSGLLICFAGCPAGNLAYCRGLIRWLEDHRPAGVSDIIPACDSLLLEFSVMDDPGRLISRLERDLKEVSPLEAEEAPLHRIPVVYDGPDLEEFSEMTGLPPADVVAIHSAGAYEVQVIGFSPGFPYLGPLDDRLHLARRGVPRVRVPAGSVAVGGSHTGIYSIASPGGWWLLGRTQVEMFSLRKAQGVGGEDAFLLCPGDRVCFEPVER
jgi:KipI family sensor histidine kinase inhibitor